MRALVFGRIVLGIVGVVLLVIPALAVWRSVSPFPLPLEALTPLGAATAVWMGMGAALSLYAALTGEAGTSMPASVVAGTSWIPAVAETLRARGDFWGALDDPAVVVLTSEIVIAAASLGALLVIASIAMRRVTPAT